MGKGGTAGKRHWLNVRSGYQWIDVLPPQSTGTLFLERGIGGQKKGRMLVDRCGKRRCSGNWILKTTVVFVRGRKCWWKRGWKNNGKF